jgi:predicted ArsR family transcriptional regulator
VLESLQRADTPLPAGTVAGRVRLHANTARFHLDGLVEAGLVERDVEEREQPGRPRILYTARRGSPQAGQRSYQLLAQILTSYVAGRSPKPAEAGQQAGQAWGRYLADKPLPFRRLSGPEATEQLTRMLDDIGFAPETATRKRDQQVRLHHCPFRETAEQHQDVVCSVHLGLMQGLLAALDAPVEAQRLDPFVEPDLCVTHLGRRASRPASKRNGRPKPSARTPGR